MPDSTKEATQPKGTTTPVDVGALPAETRDNFEAFIEANEAIINGLAALNQEAMAFGNKRLRENIVRSESLVDCKGPEDAFRVQCEFLHAATQQYLEQTNHMMAAMTKMAESFWGPLQVRTAETLRALDQERR